MKRILSRFGLFLVVSLILAGGFTFSVSNAYAATWYVDPAGTNNVAYGTSTGASAFLTIQYAINAATTSDTINVAAGTYVEQVLVNKNLTLSGTGNPMIKAPASPIGYTFTESGSTFEPVVFAFGGTLTGSAISGADQVTVNISGITVDGNARIPSPTSRRAVGILYRNVIGGVTDCTIQNMGNSTATLASWGILTYGTLDAIIHGNTISGYGTAGIGISGIALPGIEHVVIDGNIVTGTTSIFSGGTNGIQVSYGATGHVTNNTVSLNHHTSNNAAGILIVAAPSVVVDGNTVTSNDLGIVVQGVGPSLQSVYGFSNSTNTIVQNNIVTSNLQGGIIVDQRSTDTLVQNNTIAGNNHGIQVGNSSIENYRTPPTGTVIHNNMISGSTPGYGLYVYTNVAQAVDATSNWWGTSTKSVIEASASGTINILPYYINSGMTTLSNIKAITGFTISGQTVSTTINEGAKTIVLTMPYGTNVTALVPTITQTGASVSPISGTSTDFTSPATYIVTAIDETTQPYTVTVNLALNSAKAITGFSVTGQVGTTGIDETNHTITFVMSTSSGLTTLAPTITKTGVLVSAASGEPHDFTATSTYTVTADDSSTQAYVVTAVVLAATQTAPVAGVATISTTTPEVVITNPNATTTLTINSGTYSTNPTIDLSAFIGSNGTGTLPAINITSANAYNDTIAIPASTIVTSVGSTTWNGVMEAPTPVTSVTLPPESGQTKTLSTAIELGLVDTELAFNKAVRILFLGQAGMRAGYVRTGITFTEITDICDTDTQNTTVNSGSPFSTDGECKINVGTNDLAIWTKHFTTFATYSQTTNAVVSSGGGGGVPATIPTNTSVFINNGATLANSRNVTLNLAAAGASYMMVSNLPNFSDVLSWETYALSKPWVLTAGDGLKMVYAKFRSTTGNESGLVSDSITLQIGAIVPSTQTTTTTTTNTTTTSNASGYNFTKYLTLGSKGTDVTELQKILVAEGYLNMPAGVAYGYFGSLTQNAVRKYQKNYGIDQLGVVGPLTRQSLNSSNSLSARNISSMTLKELIQMLLQIGAIAPDKIDAANRLINSL